MREPIKGFADGKDYEIACSVARLFAKENGWSMTERRRSNRIFDYEFSMCRLGNKDSAKPKMEIKVGYDGGRKCIAIKRRGNSTAIIALTDDGDICFGHFSGDKGIDDLVLLREFYLKAKQIAEAGSYGIKD